MNSHFTCEAIVVVDRNHNSQINTFGSPSEIVAYYAPMTPCLSLLEHLNSRRHEFQGNEPLLKRLREVSTSIAAHCVATALEGP